MRFLYLESDPFRHIYIFYNGKTEFTFSIKMLPYISRSKRIILSDSFQ